MPNVGNLPKVKPRHAHYRIIHSRFPPKNVFDGVSNNDAEILGLGESETNERLNNWSAYVNPLDAKFGSGWGAVMASFCYPSRGRFSTDEAGAYYCAKEPLTALREWTFHTAHHWRSQKWTNEVSAVTRSYKGYFKQKLVDITGHTELLDPNSYDQSIAFSIEARKDNIAGISFPSVRDEGGQCFALFSPTATSEVTQSKHYAVLYDGHSFTKYAEISAFNVF